MPPKTKFSQHPLTHSMHLIGKMQFFPQLICTSLLCISPINWVFAQETLPVQVPNSVPEPTNGVTQSLQSDLRALEHIQTPDSLNSLNQQIQHPEQIQEFNPIQLENLDNLPDSAVDPNMVNEIFRVAEEAKRDALNTKNGANIEKDILVSEATQAELSQLTQAPVNIDRLMQDIASENKINVQVDESGHTLQENEATEQKTEDVGFIRRVLNRFNPNTLLESEKVPRITADVEGAPPALAKNIAAKLSSFTQESFEDFNASLPQLRVLAHQAAQAIGYYQAEFRFEKVSPSKLKVVVTPNEPVRIKEQNIDFSGKGASQPQFAVIPLVPDQDVGDIFHHGLYEQTKTRIEDAASNNGFFDAYWRLHDVKVAQPENTAEINLRYETGERYKMGDVEFRMSDPKKPLPINLNILRTMAPWKVGDDYAFWRVNLLANNLTNSRYFNYTLVDTIKPDALDSNLELPPDVQKLVDQNQIQVTEISQNKNKNIVNGNEEVSQSAVDEKLFAGTAVQNESRQEKGLLTQAQKKAILSERENLQETARETKTIPVIVTLNADRLNALETGIGYGTDTGVRLRSQYRRSIVNRYGHAFDSNLELSEIRQSIDGRYSIPYKHPLNDYFNLVGGYEREERGDIGPDVNLMIESAVLGGERVIKNPLGNWQHNFGLRYRLDRLTQKGEIDENNIPNAFRAAGLGSEQQSLLLGYEASKMVSNERINPTKAFKQSYKIELGSDSLLSDANMAILSAGWRFIYSLGESADHQFIGRSDFSYIFTDDFNHVPYNLRFFAGGDQTLRGFDYKSLSPEIAGYKIGGQALAIGSMEYNYQFKEGWRAAIFSDFGNAYDKSFSNPTAYSIGLGIRWQSPIGSIRLDVASGISDENKPIRLHFFIGPQI